MVHLKKAVSVAITLAIGLGGCTSPNAEEGWPEPRPLGRDVPAFRPPPSPDDYGELPLQTAESEGDLTLREAVALALLRSPDLATFGWEVRAREASVLQAGLPPNPGLSASVENLATSRKEEATTGGIQTTIQLGQLIELGGKRSSRIEVASRERDVAGWEYEIRRIDLLSRVSQLFIEVLSAQRRIALMEEAVRLAEQSAAAVSERVKAGKVSPVEETKANVALSTARIGLERSKRELEASRKALSGTWGSRTPRFKSALGELDSVPAIPAIERLTGLLDQNPTLALWAAEMSMRKAAVELARSHAIPDLTVAAGYRRYTVSGEDDVDAMVVGFSIPLPVFSRNQGGVREALYRVARSQEERRLAEVRLAVELGESYKALSSAYSEATALRDTVLPGAQSAFDAVSEGYRLGRFGLLDVLDSQRTLFEVRSQHLRAATEYHKAVVDVERLVGDRLESAK
ncbi:MAG: TolC family protein [Planctomycetes bacterium]|nr:TolC family protein [Planctomycetota bacterium]